MKYIGHLVDSTVLEWQRNRCEETRMSIQIGRRRISAAL